MGICRVACIGDSLTFGFLMENQPVNCYPSQLNLMLGEHYCVRNFGVNGATMLKSGDGSYWHHENFKLSLEFNPQIVVMMLGTNDSNPCNWTTVADYSKDYEQLIKHYQSLPTKPKIYLMTPPTAFITEGETEVAFGVDNDRIQEMRVAIKEIGIKENLTVIDLNQMTATRPELFHIDGVHTNASGARLIAVTVYETINID